MGKYDAGAGRGGGAAPPPGRPAPGERRRRRRPTPGTCARRCWIPVASRPVQRAVGAGAGAQRRDPQVSRRNAGPMHWSWRRTRFNDYGPLLRLRRFDAARALLRDCRAVFEAERDGPRIGRGVQRPGRPGRQDRRPRRRRALPADGPGLHLPGRRTGGLRHQPQQPGRITWNARAPTPPSSWRTGWRRRSSGCKPNRGCCPPPCATWQTPPCRPRRRPLRRSSRPWRPSRACALPPSSNASPAAPLRQAQDRRRTGMPRSRLCGSWLREEKKRREARRRREAFEPLLQGIAAAASDAGLRGQIEPVLADLEEKGWRLRDPAHRLWAGERNPAALTAGLDDQDSRPRAPHPGAGVTAGLTGFRTWKNAPT